LNFFFFEELKLEGKKKLINPKRKSKVRSRKGIQRKNLVVWNRKGGNIKSQKIGL
jgi:hypothetical protein